MVIKYFILLFLVPLTHSAYGQLNLYTFNSDSYFTGLELDSLYHVTNTTIAIDEDLEPIIYHRKHLGDTTLNFIKFIVTRRKKSNNNVPTKALFKQDSLFLLLDRKLPDAILVDINGRNFSSQDFLGKPTLINFWSTYCGPCIREMPALNLLKEKFGNAVNFIAITPEADIGDFLLKQKFNFIHFLDGQAYLRRLGVTALPRNILVDKKGYIRYILGNYPILSSESKPSSFESDDNIFIRILQGFTKN